MREHGNSSIVARSHLRTTCSAMPKHVKFSIPSTIMNLPLLRHCVQMCVCLTSVCVSVRADDSKVDFRYQIRPILSRHCFACHGPDPSHRMAGLRLDDRDSAITDVEVIVPGAPDESTLVDVISSEDDDVRMPPSDAGSRLSDEEIRLIRLWIEQGARYSKHWSYEKPQRLPPPTVASTNWPRNEIDLFILARLEEDGLRPQNEADRYTLIRRVSLDLTGIPPTIEETQAFIADKDENAYERVVDRLLASPRYGERWAAKWLDLARYADTDGYEKDSRRAIWPYRDWVIKAFNADMPFDQFTIEQIAGDLLPNPTNDQLIATAFHRNTMTNEEGGTDDEEFRVAAVVDRVNTTMQVWMGTTMGCAQCHSHKYDPISHTSYFATVSAIFLSTAANSASIAFKDFFCSGVGSRRVGRLSDLSLSSV